MNVESLKNHHNSIVCGPYTRRVKFFFFKYKWTRPIARKPHHSSVIYNIYIYNILARININI